MKRASQITASLIFAVAFSAPAPAQNHLTDLPDPDPQVQQDALRLDDNLEVTLFAHEPDLINPIQMNWDPQGRLWVATSETYPQVEPGQIPDDKIVVLEDTTGDGRADKRTVFADGLLMPTGVVPGDGGAYVANSTELLHLKDTTGDGKADQRRVVLSGFGTEDTHHIIHTFRWGPDGALYFNQSIYIHSHVETPWGPERLLAGGIWRLRPNDLRLSVFSRGWVNAWGHIFDEWGQSFVTDGAGHEGINYTFPGAAFMTARGAPRILQGLNPGQPKHSGLEVVSGRHFPESWQGNLITNDFRGNRVNRFVISQSGSGYVSRQAADPVTTSHVAFRPVDVQMGPDGAIYIADWYNPIIQHGEVDFRDDRRDREHGRIWRITYKDRDVVEPPDLVNASTPEVLDALKLPEGWTRQQAKRVLAERPTDEVIPALEQWVEQLDTDEADYERHLLEALWVRQSHDAVDASHLDRVLTADDARARAAAVRVLADWHRSLSQPDAKLARAVEDPHARVRLEAVNALRERDTAEAARIAMRALDDEVDRFLDYALWLTARELRHHWLPELEQDPLFFGDEIGRAVFAVHAVADALAAPEPGTFGQPERGEAGDNVQALDPLVELYQQGRLSDGEAGQVVDLIVEVGGPDALDVVFERAMEDSENREALLAALERAAEQRGAMPDANARPRVVEFFEAEHESERAAAMRLAGRWQLGVAHQPMAQLAGEPATSDELRRAAVQGLAHLDSEESRAALAQLTEAEHPIAVRLAALVGLAQADLAAAAERAADALADAEGHVGAAADVFDAFYRRQEGPGLLRAAIEGRSLPGDVASVGLRRTSAAGRSLPDIEATLREAGQLSAVDQMLSDDELAALVAEIEQQGDPHRGEQIYRRPGLACIRCHSIGGAGGNAGPDLISLGSAAPIELIIQQVLQPSETIKEGYHTVTVTTTEGRVVTGLLERETDTHVVLRNAAGEEVRVPLEQVDEQAVSPISLMPPGLTANLTRDEFVDLIRFLSELGRDGEFNIGSDEVVRRWRRLEPSGDVDQAIIDGGISGAVADRDQFRWSPIYSRVSGDLDLGEIDRVGDDDRYHQRYRVLRFDLEVTAGGVIDLELNEASGAQMWLEDEAVTLDDRTATLNLPRGEHAVFLAINDDERSGGDIRVTVRERDDSPGRAQVVDGP